MDRQFAPKCLVATLGMGNNRLQRIKDHRGDFRFRIWGSETMLSICRFQVLGFCDVALFSTCRTILFSGFGVFKLLYIVLSVL